MTESFTDIDGNDSDSIDQVIYGTITMMESMVEGWKEHGIDVHQGIILLEFKVCVYHRFIIPFSDRVGFLLHFVPSPGILMKIIGAEFL